MLAALAVLQGALAAGAPLGHLAWGGRHRVLPANLRAGSVVAIALYAVFAILILQRAGFISVLPETAIGLGLWAPLAFLILGTGANAVSRSLPERRVMTPITALLAALVFIVSMGW